MRSDDIHPGDIIGGKYRVRAIVSRIPTLAVEAFHVEFDQRVIIKVLPPGTGDDKEIERFRREARVLAKLETEHAARILDVGTQGDGAFYLVRQQVEGDDLAAYVQKYGPRPLSEGVLLALQVAECLAETHANGIVLRELSPQNIVVGRRASGTPIAKVTDFGTAKLMKDASAPAGQHTLTSTALFGLSSYSSPELVRKAKNVDPRTDIWSLGAVLYFMLTGRPPFSGDIARLMLSITREEPTPVTSIRHDLAPDIDNIISWALAKDLDRRFKTIHSFAHALAPYAPPEGQVLIERIAQIAHGSQKGRERTGAMPYMAQAPGRQSGGTSVIPTGPSPHIPIRGRFEEFEGISGEEDATQVFNGFAPASSPQSSPPPPPSRGSMSSEVTTLLPSMSAASDPSPPRPPSRGLPVPPPPPSLPPSPFVPSGGPKPGPARQRPNSPPESQSFGRFDPPANTQSAVTQRVTVARPGSFDMRILWGALAAIAVMLPVILLLLLRSGPPVPAPAAQSERPANEAPKATEPAAPAAQPTAAPVVVKTSEVRPIDTAPPIVLSADPEPEAVAIEPKAKPTATGAKPVRTAKTPDPKPTATAAKEEPKEEPASGGSGRLLAIASGGSCSFSVDGGSKGSGSSLSLSLPAGKHTVVCKPSSGAAKSRGVTIKANETAMLTFKL